MRKFKRTFIISDWLRNLANKLFPKEVNDSYLYDNMEDAMEDWLEIYYDEPFWEQDCHGKTLNLGASVASEFARLITIEFESEITGSERAKFLNKQYERLLDILRIKLEVGCACGGIIFKPYVKNGVILPDCITQDNFLPIEYDSEHITGAIFIDQQIKNGIYFTRIEKQVYDYQTCTHIIESRFFVSKSQDTFGDEVDPKGYDIWADYQPYVTIENVDRPLFAFWRVPFANQIDKDSPLGVSVYSRAVKLLKEADLQWDRYLWEFKGGELAVHAGEEVLRRKPYQDGKNISGRFEMPETRERLFRLFDVSSDDEGKAFYNVYNPNLRDENYSSGLNEIKRQIEFNCSLAYGTLSNPNNVDKTAEEIKASKQRSYAAIKDMQTSLEAVLEDYIYALDTITTVCHLFPAGDYEVSFNWGDGVLEDKDKEQAIQLQEVNSRIRKPTDYLKWRYGLDDDQAQTMLPKTGTTSFFDEGGGS